MHWSRGKDAEYDPWLEVGGPVAGGGFHRRLRSNNQRSKEEIIGVLYFLLSRNLSKTYNQILDLLTDLYLILLLN